MDIHRKILKVVPGCVLVALFLFVGLKGCVVTYWHPPKQPQAYAIFGGDKREMSFTIYPDGRALVTYGDPGEDLFEAALLKMHGGEYGTHYFGPFWNISSPRKLWGYRWISGEAEPVILSLEVLNKLQLGNGESALAEIGSDEEMVVYFRPKGLKFLGMWLTAVEYDAATSDSLVSALERK